MQTKNEEQNNMWRTRDGGRNVLGASREKKGENQLLPHAIALSSDQKTYRLCKAASWVCCHSVRAVGSDQSSPSVARTFEVNHFATILFIDAYAYDVVFVRFFGLCTQCSYAESRLHQYESFAV
jgi:hypothetical protein